MLIRNVQLLGFRGFEEYRLDDLARVNLIVGKNNSGKTSVLEALYVLATRAGPVELLDLAEIRGEQVMESSGSSRSAGQATPTIRYFFRGPVNLASGPRFVIRADDGAVSVSARISESSSQLAMPGFEEDDDSGAGLVLSFESSGTNGSRKELQFPLFESGAAPSTPVMRLRRRQRSLGSNQAILLTPEALLPDRVGSLWDEVIRLGQETVIVDALRLLEPDLQNITFLSGMRSLSRLAEPGILVGLSGAAERVPIGSLGDGMRRLLLVSLALARSRKGVLIIDEIDTGLHYSCMADLWNLVVQSAKKLDVQVFATTHSKDCIEGLAEFVESNPRLKNEVVLHKIDRNLPVAVTLHPDEVLTASKQNIEVR